MTLERNIECRLRWDKRLDEFLVSKFSKPSRSIDWCWEITQMHKKNCLPLEKSPASDMSIGHVLIDLYWPGAYCTLEFFISTYSLGKTYIK